MKFLRNFGVVLVWIIYTILIMCIFPIYLLLYPFEWAALKPWKVKPTKWWWKLGDHLEENVLPVPA